MNRDKVILVDIHDNFLGEMDKLEAHRSGRLHRAFSIFIFNTAGEMLLQQRAADKYHGGGLWTNACCSHPQWGEVIEESAIERLYYEMKIRCPIEKAFSFIYKAPVENHLIEYEFDHVFIGYSDACPQPRPSEVQAYQWICPQVLQQKVTSFPELFTYWFRVALGKVLEKIALG